MLFNSLEFLLFLPIVFGIYWLLRDRLRAQNLFVVVASYVFYERWDWYNNRPHGTPKGAGKSDEVKDFNEPFFAEVVSALHEVQESGVKVVMFPPALERNAYIDKQKKIEYIISRFSEAGFRYACVPDLDAMDKSMFYDTVYHLNHEGR